MGHEPCSPFLGEHHAPLSATQQAIAHRRQADAPRLVDSRRDVLADRWHRALIIRRAELPSSAARG